MKRQNRLRKAIALLAFAAPISLVACDLKRGEYVVNSALSQSSDTYKKQLKWNKKGNYFLYPSLQNAKSKKRMRLDKITSKQGLVELPSLLSLYNSDILVGGYSEGRKFYAGEIDQRKNEWINFHLGNDITLPNNTPIFAPHDGEILAAWWYAPDKEEVGRGVGGTVLLRQKASDLGIKDYVYIKKISKKRVKNKLTNENEYVYNEKKWVAKLPKMMFEKDLKESAWKYSANNTSFSYFVTDENEYNNYLKTLDEKARSEQIEKSKYVYIYFIHLSKDSIRILDKNAKEISFQYYNKGFHARMANIDIDNPLKVKQGDVIGRLGDVTENGGWGSHVHVEAYAFLPDKRNRMARTLGFNNITRGKYIVKDDWNKRIPKDNKWDNYSFRKQYSNAKAIGTSQIQIDRVNSHNTLWEKKGLDFEDYYAFKDGAINTKKLFNLWDNETDEISVELD